MWMFVVVYLGTIHILRCSDISSLNQYDSDSSDKRDWNTDDETDKSREDKVDKTSHEAVDKSSEEITTIDTTMDPSIVSSAPDVSRRYWLSASKIEPDLYHKPPDVENEKDANLKSKISTLVEQTLHDTERKLRSLHRLKEKHKNEAPYRIGFILSLVKKSKDVLSELFNVAVKHREDYKALEELKIFEFIIHTNVDTTNLVRQMVEIHIENVNSSHPFQHKNRVILL